MTDIISEERLGMSPSITSLPSISHNSGTHNSGAHNSSYDKVSNANASMLNSGVSHPLRAIQIIERWDFARGCLAFWLRQACPDYEIMAPPDFEHSVDDGFHGRIAAVVVGRETLHLADDWLEHELASVRRSIRDVPIVAIISADLMDKTEILTKRLGLSGYILTSDSTDVASAALRLVMAGGTHFPRIPTVDPLKTRLATDASDFVTKGFPRANLTVKEKAVVHCLGRGNPNKVIAQELNMSLSTVKAHVHSIIRKLNVNNRTGIAVAAQLMQDVIWPAGGS